MKLKILNLKIYKTIGGFIPPFYPINRKNMSEKTIKVLNTRDRYYNGAYKGQILEVPEIEKDHYLNVWFTLVWEDKKVEKNNIVKEDNRTVKQLKELLDHNGVEYDKKANKPDLLKLVKEFKKKSENNDENKADIETLKKELLENAIVTEEELEKMQEAEIVELAKNNWLTE